MTTDRIPCCIIGCRRTFERGGKPEGWEIMCGRHWKMVDRVLRERHKRAKARLRKIDRLGRVKVIQKKGIDRIRHAWDLACARQVATWTACKEDATIKVALGAEDAPRRRPQHAEAI